MPAIDTLLAETANWCCTVINGSLLFNARQDYETHTTNTHDYLAVGHKPPSPTRFHVQAASGNLAGVQAELDKGVDVNVVDLGFFNLAALHLCGW